MNARILRSVLAHATAAAGGPDVADGDLLARVASGRDEAAFAELVRRHGRLVWAVCRHLSPSEADADDAFQATFLALWQGAGKIQSRGTAAPWLHAVAHRVTGRARRTAARRLAREKKAATGEADSRPPPSAWDATLTAVHEEVAALPESLRVPFVLCILDGLGPTDAAARLGWKLGTLSGRLTRAKQALLDRLAKRGLPAAAVGAVLVGPAGTVPAAVIGKCFHLTTAVPSSIQSLAHGVTGMTIPRIKLLAAGLLLAGGLTAGVGGWRTTAADPPKAADSAKPTELVDPLDVRQMDTRYLNAWFAEAKPAEPPGKWEYDFLTLPQSKPGVTTYPDSDGYRKWFREKEAKGWEFVGGLTARVNIGTTDGGVLSADEPVLVFRRPYNAERVKADAARQQQWQEQGMRFLLEDLTDTKSSVRITADPVAKLKAQLVERLKNNPGARFGPALDAAIGDNAQLKAAVDAKGRTALEAEVMTELVAALRKEASSGRLPSPTATASLDWPAELSKDEFFKLLMAAARKRFPNAAFRVMVALKGDRLEISGPPDQVEWAAGVAKTLTGEK